MREKRRLRENEREGDLSVEKIREENEIEREKI